MDFYSDEYYKPVASIEVADSVGSIECLSGDTLVHTSQSLQSVDSASASQDLFIKPDFESESTSVHEIEVPTDTIPKLLAVCERLLVQLQRSVTRLREELTRTHTSAAAVRPSKRRRLFRCDSSASRPLVASGIIDLPTSRLLVASGSIDSMQNDPAFAAEVDAAAASALLM